MVGQMDNLIAEDRFIDEGLNILCCGNFVNIVLTPHGVGAGIMTAAIGNV